MSETSTGTGQNPKPARPCPSCGTSVTPETEFYPFCSERCRLVDLGKWMDERYRIGQRDPDLEQ